MFNLKLKVGLACLALCILLIGCNYSGQVNTLEHGDQVQENFEIESSPTLDSTAPDVAQNYSEPQQCQDEFISRELREPYQRYDGDNPRFTLSEEELLVYLDLMGVADICLPPQFGAPFINVDWNAEDLPATGRMVSIGFEDLYGGGGWSQGYLVYATYDFSIGSEYEIFASPSDFEQVENGLISTPLNPDGVRGFIRYHRGIPMGKQMVMKTYVFPFENTYLAVVINLGAYDPAEVEKIISDLEAGGNYDINQDNIALMDLLVSSIQFR